MRSFRDLDMAEDLYQEACLRASERWPLDGVPRDPTAWLIKVRAVPASTSSSSAATRLRRRDSARGTSTGWRPSGGNRRGVDRTEYKDDVLRLTFSCCHPELKAYEQLAMALKVVVGFSVEEIARAFCGRDTMQRRLSAPRPARRA